VHQERCKPRADPGSLIPLFNYPIRVRFSDCLKFRSLITAYRGLGHALSKTARLYMLLKFSQIFVHFGVKEKLSI
jgi:hypothetical protein